MTRDNVDDIVASVEDAVRRAYALGRADAMKRVVELAQSDDSGLRAMALLGPAEPARPAPPPALLDAPQPSPAQLPEHQPVESHEQAADAADDRHEARQDATAVEPSPAPQPAMAGQPEREPPASVGEFLADFFYPIGSKKR
jgi:hypothetical protein